MCRALIFVFALGMLIPACSRDDICSREAPVTPLLIVRFYDSQNPVLTKPVEELAVFADTLSESLFPAATTDSIALPLMTSEDATDYTFLRRADDSLSTEFEYLTFSYQRQTEYVSRACAYRVVYENLSAERDTGASFGWIDDIQVITDSITPAHQHEAHIHIYH